MDDEELLLIKHREKNPQYFRIYDERQLNQFKSQAWIKNEQEKKQSTRQIVFKNLKQMLYNFDGHEIDPKNPAFREDVGSFMSIESGISVKVKNKYCDFTGFPSRYTHKESTMRFLEQCHVKVIEKLPFSKVEEVLGWRKAVAALK